MMLEQLNIFQQKNIIKSLKQMKLDNTLWDKAVIFEADRIYNDNTIWAKNYFVQLNKDFLSIFSSKFGIEECENFQSELLGENFFHEKTALRWNYYLYFVLSDSKILKFIEKDNIESDTHYARKRIVSIEKIGELLEPIGYKNQDKEISDPEDEWLTILSKNGLEECLTNAQYSSYIQNYVENNMSVKLPASFPKSISEETKNNLSVNRIKRIEMKNYRADVFGNENSLNFGLVNLIEGHNGSGKSSIIDAIELALTCSIKRFEDTNGKLAGEQVLAKVLNKTVETVDFYSNGKPDNREREQAWYNTPKTRLRSTLSEKFGQVNRFSIESVFALVKSQCLEQDGTIQDIVSKLCFGEKLSLIEKNWKTYSRRFADEKGKSEKELDKLLTEQNYIKNKMQSLEKEIKNRQVDISSLYSCFFNKQSESVEPIKRLEDLYLRTKNDINSLSIISENINYSDFKSALLNQKEKIIQLQKQISIIESTEKEYALIKQKLEVNIKKQEEASEFLTFFTDISQKAAKLFQEMKMNSILEDNLESLISTNERNSNILNALIEKHQSYFESNIEEVLISEINADKKSYQLQKSIDELNGIIHENVKQKEQLDDEKSTINQELDNVQKLQTELIQHGKEIINTTKRSNCPLCGHIYSNATQLLNIITNSSQQNNIPIQSRLVSITKKIDDIQKVINAARQRKTKLEEEKKFFESISEILQTCKQIIDLQNYRTLGALWSSIRLQANNITKKLINFVKMQKEITMIQNEFMNKGIQKSVVGQMN